MVLMKGYDAEVSCSTATLRARKAASSPQPQGGFTVSLEIAAPAGPHPRHRVARHRRGSRRLFRDAAEAGADRRLASKQSQPLESRFAFEQAIAKVAARYLIGEVPRPPGGAAGASRPRGSSSGTTVRSAARPHRIPPRRARSALVQGAALSLTPNA